jgi:hypothetical protein
VHSQGRTRHSKASRLSGFDLGEAALDLVVLIPDELDDVALAGGRGRGPPLSGRALPLPTRAERWLPDVWGRDGGMDDQSARESREDRPGPTAEPDSGAAPGGSGSGLAASEKAQNAETVLDPDSQPEDPATEIGIRSTGSSVTAGRRVPQPTPSLRRRPTPHPADGGWWWSGQSKSPLMRATISSAFNANDDVAPLVA